AGGVCTVLHDADRATFRAWMERLAATGFRPVSVHGHGRSGEPRFAAIAVKDDGPLTWGMWLDGGIDHFQKSFEHACDQRFVPASLSGYEEGRGHGFVSLWHKPGTFTLCRHAADAALIRREAGQQKSAGSRMISLSSYATANGLRYTTVYGPDPGK